MTGTMLAFLGVAFVIIATPGPDTALTIRNGLSGGRRGGIGTAAGVALGQLVWAVAAGFGVATLLQTSQLAFEVLRWAGAAYLILLGARSIWSAFRRHAAPQVDSAGREGPSVMRALQQGLISNLANPKMPAFFLSLLPQFVVPGDGRLAGFIALGAIFAAMTFAWLTGYAVLIHRMRALFERSGVRRTLEAVTGVALVALGIRVAVDRTN